MPDDNLPAFDEQPSPATSVQSDDFVPPAGLLKGCKRINAELIASLKECIKKRKERNKDVQKKH